MRHCHRRWLITPPSGSARLPTLADLRQLKIAAPHAGTTVQLVTYTLPSKTVVLASARDLGAGGLVTEPSLIEYSLP